jgi:hypothetical protein
MEMTPPPMPPTVSPAPDLAVWGQVPTVEIVDRIAALADPMIRNLQITQSYCELSQALSQLIGSGANWCTFATWASKQAGVTIRLVGLQRSYALHRRPVSRLSGMAAALRSGVHPRAGLEIKAGRKPDGRW